MPCTGNNPVPTREGEQGHLPQPERRRRVAEERRRIDGHVRGPPAVTGGQDPEADAGRARHDQRGRDEQQRGREPLRDHGGHGPAVHERRAQIAPKHVRDVGQQLLGQRAIEPEAGAEEGVVGRVPVLAAQGDRRVTGGQVNDAEVQHEQPGHGGQDLGEPPQQIARRHAALTVGRRPPRRRAPSMP